jgi:hypothetical protein
LNELERAAWLTRCDIEHDDFRAALDFLFQTRDLDWGFRFCIALFRFWDMREHSAEGRTRLEQIIELAGGKYARERQNVPVPVAFTTRGGFPCCRSLFRTGALAVRGTRDPWGVHYRGTHPPWARDQGDYITAQATLRRA